MRKMDCRELLVGGGGREEDVMKVVRVVRELVSLVGGDGEGGLIGDLLMGECVKDILNSLNEVGGENGLEEKKSELEGRSEVKDGNRNEEVGWRGRRSRERNGRGGYKLEKRMSEGGKGVGRKKRRVGRRVRGRK
ncbi:hypothetical protein ACRFB9_28165 [Klebsiella pneumoniae]